MNQLLLCLLLAGMAASPVALADDPPPSPPGQAQSPAAQSPPPAQPRPGVAPGRGMADVRTACMSDVQKLCTGVQPGGGRIVACLKEHKDQVSDGCKQAIAAAKTQN